MGEIGGRLGGKWGHFWWCDGETVVVKRGGMEEREEFEEGKVCGTVGMREV